MRHHFFNKNIRTWLALLATMALGACASTPPQKYAQLTVPPQVSNIYSDMNMQLHLIAEPNAPLHCTDEECNTNLAFNQQVIQLGSRLAQSAFETYPHLKERIGQFEFVIVEKSEPGSISNAAGTVAIFRGVQKLNLDEEAMAFLIAREMGHIIGGHHDENSSTSIWFSLLTQLLMPVTGLFHGASAIMETSSVSTATSFIGSRVVIANYRDKQIQEADAIALGLLNHQGLDKNRVANALTTNLQVTGEDRWSREFRISSLRVSQPN